MTNDLQIYLAKAAAVGLAQRRFFGPAMTPSAACLLQKRAALVLTPEFLDERSRNVIESMRLAKISPES
jgi:hypothetical protein